MMALVVALVLTAVPAPAQLAPKGGWVNAEGRSPFVAVVERVKDAVVNISAEKVVDARRYHNFEPFFEDWFGDRGGPSRQKSLGSGFIYRSDGYIITNYHVISGADNITVRLSDKKEFPARVVGSDQATDLALLKIDADHPLPAIALGSSDSLLVGDWVIAIGNPFPSQGLDRTVTVGVISALGRKSLYFGDETPVYQDFIQTDASINPGNSGGPLINLDGEVIGINSAIASPTGSSVGIGFAIPVDFAKLVIPDLLAEGRVKRGWLGIEPRDLEWDDVEAEGLASAEGVIINRVLPRTPAERAQLRVGDVVLRVNGERIIDAQHFMRTIWRARAGAVVRLDLIRNGEPMTIDVTLGDRDAARQATSTETEEDFSPTPVAPDMMWLGMRVETATPSLAQEFGAEYNPGVIVVDIDRTGPAYDKGIREGMIIAEIDHEPIRDVNDFLDVAARKANEKAVSFLVYDQRGRTGYISVRPSH
ncbi:MAG TPA: Do family serine endopeptidase [bacterium]|nr:Do family serine endopeptidase [bacterium]